MARGMAALAEADEGVAGDPRQFRGMRNDLDLHVLEDTIQLRPGDFIRMAAREDMQTAAVSSIRRENASASGSRRRIAIMAEVSTAITVTGRFRRTDRPR